MALREKRTMAASANMYYIKIDYKNKTNESKSQQYKH